MLPNPNLLMTRKALVFSIGKFDFGRLLMSMKIKEALT